MATQENSGTIAAVPAIGAYRDKSAFLHVTLRIWLKLYQGAIAFARPFFDLVIRVALALILLRSGLLKFYDWDLALSLATHEYPVSFMAPATAAALGITIELLGGFLLIIGLFTRLISFAVMALFIVSQMTYVAADMNLFIIAFASWYVVRGAGGFSLDRAFQAGLADSPLPFSAQAVALGRWLTQYAVPFWLLLARIWLAVTIFAAINILPELADSRYLPVYSFSALPVLAAISIAVLAVFGLAMPLLSVVLVVLLSAGHMMGVNENISLLTSLFSLMFLFFGSGYVSVDGVIGGWLERNILFTRAAAHPPEHWPHIAVIGGGFGGLAAVAELKKLPVRITLIDRHNYHLFQPLLYQVATAALSPADVATPIRSLYRNDCNVRVILGEVKKIDKAARRIFYGQSSVDYDYLVLATGASHSYFGKDEWAEFAPGLKRIEDGVAVRGTVLSAFEKAESSTNDERIERLLTFVIVGGGPTGVELAGAIAELAHHGLKGEYRHIDPAKARIILVQSGDRILPAFPEDLSYKAAKSLENLGVEIMLNHRVTDIKETHVELDGENILPTETVLWAAGVVASPAGQWIEAETDRAGRIMVGDDLKVQGEDRIFAIGDTASSNAWEGKPVPGLAPAAKQAGKYVSRYIKGLLTGKPLTEPFIYKHQGSLATIGRKSAVADFGFISMSGALAWWFWGAVHVGFLVGVRNRVSVLLNWIWNFFTLQLGIRLITGNDPEK